MLITPAKYYRKEVISLLTQQGLPCSDLPKHLSNFFVMLADDKVIAVVGLEVYGRNGLLRSVAVKTEFRNQGIAGQLVEKVIETATNKALVGLFLLTDKAKDYFLARGFEVISRDLVSPVLKRSSELTSVCPATATVMFKTLINKKQ